MGENKQKPETVKWKVSLGIVAYYLSLEGHNAARHVTKGSNSSCSKVILLMLHNSMFLQVILSRTLSHVTYINTQKILRTIPNTMQFFKNC